MASSHSEDLRLEVRWQRRALMEPGLVPREVPMALGVGTGVKSWVGIGWT